MPALYSRLGGLPLFSDALDRRADAGGDRVGLARLEELLPVRAPVMLERFEEEAGTLRGLLAADASGPEQKTQTQRAQALAEMNSFSLEVVDLSFNALALGQEPPAFDERCPFPGSRAFGSADRAFFFGLEQSVEQFVALLNERRVIVLAGPSGCGKSSLALAGLIPKLQEREPQLAMTYLRPGANAANSDGCRSRFTD